MRKTANNCLNLAWGIKASGDFFFSSPHLQSNFIPDRDRRGQTNSTSIKNLERVGKMHSSYENSGQNFQNQNNLQIATVCKLMQHKKIYYKIFNFVLVFAKQFFSQ